MGLTYEKFTENYNCIAGEIKEACKKSNRTVDSVAFLPVTKGLGLECLEYVARVGLYTIGESRIQEAFVKKMSTSSPLQWECIGHLQSNKVKLAVELFDRIQSVDSLPLLERIDRVAGKLGKIQRILIQVNAAYDKAKFGFLPENAHAALGRALGLKNIVVEGLMTIPAQSSLELAIEAFKRLKNLRDQLQEKWSISLPELSMGMSGDFQAAIACGSTQVRIGSKLFDLKVNNA